MSSDLFGVAILAGFAIYGVWAINADRADRVNQQETADLFRAHGYPGHAKVYETALATARCFTWVAIAASIIGLALTIWARLS